MNNIKPRIIVMAIFFIFNLSGCQPGGETAQPPVRLGEDVKETIRESLASVDGPVTLHFYRGGSGETAARETRAILEFMADMSPQIKILDYSLEGETGDAGPGQSPGVDHGPVVRMEGRNRSNFFFYGYPERKELQPFLDGVLIASGRPVNLPSGAEIFLSKLDQDIQIRIFTTPD